MNRNKPQKPATRPAVAATLSPSRTSIFIDRFETQYIWHLALLVLLPFFVYIKTVNYLFINMDDVSIIVNNFDFLSHLKNFGQAFKTDAFISAHGDFYRPLQTVSFMLDAMIGGERPLVFHLTNLLYHILTVASLYHLLRLLKITNLPALFAALIFSVHPLLASAVSWVPARGDVLIGLFGVLAFLTFIKYNSSGKKIYFLLHAITFLLALFSKETAVLIPVVLVCYHYFVSSDSGYKPALKKLLPYFIVWIASIIFFYVLRSKVVTGSPPDFIVGIKPFMQNLAAIPTNIAKFILPIRLSTMPLFEPVITAIGIILLLVVVAFVIKKIYRKTWLPVFGFAWFILFAIPPMFFKLFYSKFLLEYYEHRSYLPYIGLIIMVAYILDRLRKQPTLFVGLPLVCILLFTFLASAHSDDFKESNAFFTNAIDRGNPGAATKRGEFFMDQRDFTSALSDFNRSLELSNDQYPPAFYNRGVAVAAANKDHQAAEQDFTKTIELDSSYIEAYIKRASEKVFRSDFASALNDLAKAQQLDPTNVSIYYTKAKVLTSAMKFKEAVPLYTKAISMDSSSAEMFNDRAYVKYRLGDFPSALQDCNKAIQLFPQFLNAYYNKGMIYMELGKPKVAIATFDTTLALADNFYFGYFYRGMAKKKVNDMEGACHDWEQSVRLGFSMAQDTINRYCIKKN
jgi:tetratricopeptide (TPR) repeat protein